MLLSKNNCHLDVGLHFGLSTAGYMLKPAVWDGVLPFYYTGAMDFALERNSGKNAAHLSNKLVCVENVIA